MTAQCVEPPPRIAVGYRLEAFEDHQLTVLTREPYTLSGAPIEVAVPHIARFIGEVMVDRPLAYAVPAHVARHLARHGLTIQQVTEATSVTAEIAVVRELVSVPGRQILEAATSVHLEVDVSRQTRTLPDGWALIFTAQQRGAIAVYLCEPGSDDGLLACGLIEQLRPGEEFPAWRVHAVNGKLENNS